MSDDTQEKSTNERRPLTLRKTEKGAVKQSFPHGRTKTVVVEKKRRVRAPGEGATGGAPSPASAAPTPASEAEDAKPEAEKAKKAPAARSGNAAQAKTGKARPKVLRQLSPAEQKARQAALFAAKKQAEEKAKREAAEQAERERRAAEERAKLEAARKAQEEEDEKRRKEAEARAKAEEEARKALEAEDEERRKRNAAKSPGEVSTDRRGRKGDDNEADDTSTADDPLSALGGRIKQKRSFANQEQKTKEAPKRRSGRLTIAKALEDDERQRSLASVRRAREKEKAARAKRTQDTSRQVREVVIPEIITVQELAQRMTMRSTDLIRELMKQGQMVQANASLDADTAQLIAEDLGHTVKRVSEADVEEGLIGADPEDAVLSPRPPVVTIMGHVDHGKTSLLDALREANVVSGEAGGITQHIGAYQVDAPSGDGKITFLDTPGHAAFTAMRARGANVTDIVIIVVAADDGVMPQTVESINHARAAGVPIIVAINKIDKPGVDPNRVKTELLQHEIQVESMGGEVQDIEVSALKKINLDGLLEAIQLQAELLELTANADRPAHGTVVEAKLDKGRGPVTTFLVTAGTLKRGDVLIAGAEWGKVRALIDDKGQQIKEAVPAQPVEILGLNGVPEPGDQFVVVEHEARAREVADFRQRKKREKANAATSGTSLEQMMAQLQDAEIKDLPIVIKADVQGSVEAIVGALTKMSNKEVRVRVLHTGVGAISESDVILAEASSAPVIGFNVRANKQAREQAERSGTEVRYYSVIYDLIDDIKGTLTGMLDPELRETFLGNAEILEVFNISKVGRVAGCRVTEGQVKRGSKVRLLRDNVVIHEGELSQLKRFKDDVNEVPAGQECGMSFANYDDLKAGDVIECFDVERVERTLESVA